MVRMATGKTFAMQGGNANKQGPLRKNSRGAAALAAFALAIVAGDVPREVIQRGNEHYQAGRFAEAVKEYEAVDPAATKSAGPELLNNLAAAQFKLGKYDEARELWVRAASLRDAKFEAGIRYNLGNCNYQEAIALVDAAGGGGQADAAAQPPTGRILELLDRAVDQYRDALRLDSALTDARANIELAQQLKKKIEESSTSQPQSQPQTQPSSQPDKDQQNEGQSSQPSSQPQKGEGQSQSQPSSQPQSQPNDESSNDSKKDGESESDQPKEDEPQPDPQSQPATQPTPASQPQSQPAEEEEGEGEPIPLDMSKQEAERLLQRVRDAEQKRRAILRQREMGKHKPVDKDW